MIQYESKMRDQYILQHSDEIYDDYDEEELMHYGVPGMRWGHRKSNYAPTGDYRSKRRRRIIAGVAGAAAALGAGALLARTGRGKLVRTAIAGHARSAKRVFGPSISSTARRAGSAVSSTARSAARRVGNSTPVVGAYYHGSRGASFLKRHGATTLSSIRSGARRAGTTISGNARSANRVFGVTSTAKNVGSRVKKSAFNASLYPRYAGVVAKSYASKGASAASGVAKRAASTARRTGTSISGHARSAKRVFGPSVSSTARNVGTAAKNRAIRTAAYPVGAASAAGSAVKRGASAVTGAARRTGTKAAGAIKRKRRIR